MKTHQRNLLKEAYTEGYNQALYEQGGIGRRLSRSYADIVAAQRAARRQALKQFNKDVHSGMKPSDAVRKLRTSVGSGSDELIQNAFYYMLQQLQRGIGRTSSPFVSRIVKRMAEFVNDLLKKIREGTMTQEEALIELYDAYGQYLPRPIEGPGSGVIRTGTGDFLDRVDPDSSIKRLDEPSLSDIQKRRGGTLGTNPAEPTRRNIITPEGELSPDEAEFLRRYQEFLDRFRDRGGPGGGSVDGP